MLEYLKNKMVGSYSDRKLKKYKKLLDRINELEENYKDYRKTQCQEKTLELKERYSNGETLDELLPEAFALVRRAAMNTIDQRHYDVQIVGGIALHEGQIAEMKTGEGKTLTSTLPLYLNALTGNGCHVVTVNDYLAKRDSEWMGEIYQYLGLSVGLVLHGLNDEQRRQAYASDITYGTNNEYGFDFLRDNMKFDLKDYVQRGHHYAIIDEVDSILIDEARTPLIISGPSEESTDKYGKVDSVMYGLIRAWRVSDHPEPTAVAEEQNIAEEEVKEYLKNLEDTDIVVNGDYTLDEKSRNIQLADRGVEKIEKRLKEMLKTPNLFDFENMDVLHHVNQALKARYIFKRDIDYIVQEGRVIIIDEFTGRPMDGRRFSDGLHQALEAKEKVSIEKENQTLASITFQNYFRKYEKLSGMTGTAATEEQEFMKIYGLGVVVIPTNKPMIRKDHPDVIYKTKAAKNRAIIHQIKELYQAKQPVLVGTASIESSEKISALLKKQKIPHTVLNAKYHDKEAEIIRNAGQTGVVTIATNMAGRGTDIKLDPKALEKGGLFILGTDRHESRRIDNQLRGRSGRQGDIGASRFFLSLEDDLLRIFGGERIAKLMTRLNIDEDEAIEHVLISRSIENSQKKVEGQNFDIRKHLLEYDDVMNRQREVIYQQRREILGDEIHHVLGYMTEEIIDELIEEYCSEKYYDSWDLEGLKGELNTIFSIHLPHFDENEKLDSEYLKSVILKEIEKVYQKKEKEFGEFTQLLQRQVLLEITDSMWKEHLLTMDHLKDAVGLSGYAQKNPLDVYKKEGYYLFESLISRINKESITAYCHVRILSEPPTEIKRQQPSEMKMGRGEELFEEKKVTRMPRKKGVNIGRNNPCPCGSGKKYKNCHMKEYEQAEIA